mgnify:CR=1 FL=1
MPEKSVKITLVFGDRGNLISVLDENGKKIKANKPKHDPANPGDPPCQCTPPKRAVYIGGNCYCV